MWFPSLVVSLMPKAPVAGRPPFQSSGPALAPSWKEVGELQTQAVVCLSSCRYRGPRSGSWFQLPSWEVSNARPFLVGHVKTVVLSLSHFLSVVVTLSFQRTWQRWAAPLCRPTSASLPVHPDPGLLWSVHDKPRPKNIINKNILWNTCLLGFVHKFRSSYI